MGFTKLEERLKDLPIIIAGPMLRRVEGDSVTVWFASKQPLKKVVLTVHENDKDKKSAILSSTQENTIPLGKNLHVTAITTSKPKVSLPEGQTVMKPGKTYFYDLQFGSLQGKTLSSPWVTSAPKSSQESSASIIETAKTAFKENFCYGEFELPSFRIPDKLDNLKIVHGSCRKPHGGKTDALRALDTMLEYHANDNERPQMLILTGDQIYADDVADALLYMLMDASDALLQWNSGVEELPQNLSKKRLSPGRRQTLIATTDATSKLNKFSSSGNYAKSHLIRLGEFYSMYLFCWSPILWPQEPDMPTFKSIWGKDEGKYNYYYSAMSNTGGKTTTKTKRFSIYTNELSELVKFRASLQFVRKALANVPTYMIFDDHEITDDWFLSREWVHNCLKDGDLTRRVIQNGLAAYAIFQAWGNTPRLFQESKSFKEFLHALSDLNLGSRSKEENFKIIGNKILPKYKSTDKKGVSELSPSLIPWHYNIQYKDFQLIVLDTRTNREYDEKIISPRLISSSTLKQQLPEKKDKNLLVILVSPAPVFGHYFLEEHAQKKIKIFMGSYFKDHEAWSFHHSGYDAFLDRISDYQNIIILSGDVHYSFSTKVDYWRNRNNQIKNMTVAQLCCSSLKNSTFGTEYGIPSLSLITFALSFMSWQKKGERYIPGASFPIREYKKFHAKEVVRWPINAQLKDSTSQMALSFFKYEILEDKRKQKERLFPIIPFVYQGKTSQQKAGYIHQGQFKGGHKKNVGCDNIASISFDWKQKKISHTFWLTSVNLLRREGRESLMIPYTIHEILLTPQNKVPIEMSLEIK